MPLPPLLLQNERERGWYRGPQSLLGSVEMYSSMGPLWAGHKTQKQDKYSIHKTQPRPPLPPLSDGGGRGWRPDAFQLEVQSFHHIIEFFFFFHLDFLAFFRIFMSNFIKMKINAISFLVLKKYVPGITHHQLCTVANWNPQTQWRFSP